MNRILDAFTRLVAAETELTKAIGPGWIAAAAVGVTALVLRNKSKGRYLAHLERENADLKRQIQSIRDEDRESRLNRV
jgi:hypothetical protein